MTPCLHPLKHTACMSGGRWCLLCGAFQLWNRGNMTRWQLPEKTKEDGLAKKGLHGFLVGKRKELTRPMALVRRNEIKDGKIAG